MAVFMGFEETIAQIIGSTLLLPSDRDKIYKGHYVSSDSTSKITQIIIKYLLILLSYNYCFLYMIPQKINKIYILA